MAGCVQQPAAEAVAAALCTAAGSVPPTGPKTAALLQLHQFVLALQLTAQQEGSIASSPAPAAEQQAQQGGAAAALYCLQRCAAMQPLLAAAAAAWEAEGTHRGSKQVSAVQADVAGTARALGLTLHEEHAVVGFSGGQAAAAGDGCCFVASAWCSAICWMVRSPLMLAALLPALLAATSSCEGTSCWGAHSTHALPLLAAPAVDIAVPARRLAIEVDGPTHFCRNRLPSGSSSSSSDGDGRSSRSSGAQPEDGQQAQPLGATLLKRRLLERQGWTVVSVDAGQWERQRGAAQKRAFLAAAVADAEAQFRASTQQSSAVA